MKRFLVFLFAAAFVMIAANAFADPPAGSQESTVWYWDTLLVEWVQNPMNMEDRQGRLFRGGLEDFAGNCNKAEWLVPVEIHASIAKWIDFTLDWNRFDWFIRKPGIYCGDCIEACIAANGDVFIDYEGFDNLQPEIAGNDPISVWYGIEDATHYPMIDDNWIAAVDLNAEDDWLYDAELGELLHDGVCWKLWNKIEVVVCNSACNYSNFATITLTLDNQKPWIVPETGEWGF
jgi:hypothetical protein